jgi:hypothetical protein
LDSFIDFIDLLLSSSYFKPFLTEFFAYSITDSNTKYVNDKYVTKKKDKTKNTNNEIE